MNRQKKTAVLLVNLGTPDSSKPKDVYRYLIEFLTDGRVIDKSWLKRQLLVRGFIVPTRYKQSASSYEKIWGKAGSPLLVYSENVKKLLQESLGSNYLVHLAMRYQNPSLESVVKEIQNKKVDHLIVLPLFPQYASATIGSVHQKVFSLLSSFEVIPKVTFLNSFPKDDLYIETICDIAKTYLNENYDHFLFSFHGLPVSQLKKANACCHECKSCSEIPHNRCYKAECYETAFAIAEKLSLKKENFSLTFQSRLGKEPWLQPFTSDVIKNLGKQGIKKILVFCPSFVSDCLETIYEIGVEYKEEFQLAGGEVLDYVSSLNDHPKWIEALKQMVLRES